MCVLHFLGTADVTGGKKKQKEVVVDNGSYLYFDPVSKQYYYHPEDFETFAMDKHAPKPVITEEPPAQVPPSPDLPDMPPPPSPELYIPSLDGYVRAYDYMLPSSPPSPPPSPTFPTVKTHPMMIDVAVVDFPNSYGWERPEGRGWSTMQDAVQSAVDAGLKVTSTSKVHIMVAEYGGWKVRAITDKKENLD